MLYKDTSGFSTTQHLEQKQKKYHLTNFDSRKFTENAPVDHTLLTRNTQRHTLNANTTSAEVVTSPNIPVTFRIYVSGKRNAEALYCKTSHFTQMLQMFKESVVYDNSSHICNTGVSAKFCENDIFGHLDKRDTKFSKYHTPVMKK